MSFTHVALFTWKQSVSGTELADSLTGALKDYVADLDGVESYQCGPDVGFSSDTADYAVVGRFRTREAFVAYRDGPRHVQILHDLIQPGLAGRTLVQLED